ERVVDLAMRFLQLEHFFPGCGWPTVVPLSPGATYQDQDFELAIAGSVHPVQGLCYRFTDHRSGQVIALTGDTAYHPPLVEHVRGCRLLIHEAALGAGAADPATNTSLHSG